MNFNINEITILEIKLFLIRNLLTLGGLFIIGLSIITSWNTLQKNRITKNANQVIAKVLEAPESCDNVTKRGGYCKLEFNKRTFVIKAGREFCHLVSGKEEVYMLTNKNLDKLIFPEEYDSTDFFYSFFLFLVGAYIVYKGFKPFERIS